MRYAPVSTLSALDRHQLSRATGAPFVSVLSGSSTAEALAIWDAWLGARDYESLCVALESTRNAIDAVASDLSRGREWHRCVATYCETLLDDEQGRLELLLRDGGRPERAVLLERLRQVDVPELRVEIIGRLLTASGPGPSAVEQPEELVELLEVVSPTTRVGLMVIGPVDEALRQVVPLMQRKPDLPLAVFEVSSSRLETFLRGAASLHQAVAREGLILVPPAGQPDEASPRDADARAEVAQVLTDPSIREVRDRLRETTNHVEARSLAERLLFDALNKHRATRGAFELNRRMDFRFKSRAAELDLVAMAAMLAVEVDGAYYHLHKEAYRNDRAKDLVVQQQGFFIMRYLAEDVAPHLPRIVGEIAAIFCARTPGYVHEAVSDPPPSPASPSSQET